MFLQCNQGARYGPAALFFFNFEDIVQSLHHLAGDGVKVRCVGPQILKDQVTQFVDDDQFRAVLAFGEVFVGLIGQEGLCNLDLGVAN